MPFSDLNIPHGGAAKTLWIGKVEVRPLRGSATLGEAKGAFVNIVTWSRDSDQFRKNAEIVLGELGLFVVDVENPEPVSVRREKAAFDETVEDMVTRAQGNPNAIIYGTFHTWERDTT